MNGMPFGYPDENFEQADTVARHLLPHDACGESGGARWVEDSTASDYLDIL